MRKPGLFVIGLPSAKYIFGHQLLWIKGDNKNGGFKKNKVVDKIAKSAS